MVPVATADFAPTVEILGDGGPGGGGKVLVPTAVIPANNALPLAVREIMLGELTGGLGGGTPPPTIAGGLTVAPRGGPGAPVGLGTPELPNTGLGVEKGFTIPFEIGEDLTDNLSPGSPGCSPADGDGRRRGVEGGPIVGLLLELSTAPPTTAVGIGGGGGRGGTGAIVTLFCDDVGGSGGGGADKTVVSVQGRQA